MKNDKIVEDIRKIRDEYAARYQYDLGAIFKDLKEREKRNKRKVVSFPPKRVKQRTS